VSREIGAIQVEAVVTAEGEIESAGSGEAITLTLKDEIDISRGDVIVKGKQACVSDSFSADFVWTDG
jgi:sulfate adenylyltransferase subunit 1 (EFTu-like GTPase family)